MQKYPSVVPYLVAPEGDAELAFLKAAFGGALGECHYDSPRIAHAEVTIGDSPVIVGQPTDASGCRCVVDPCGITWWAASGQFGQAEGADS